MPLASARRVLLLVLVALLAAGCDDYPRDPSDTYERVRGGTMTVGYVPNPPWVVAGGEEPGGIEPELVRELARSLDARVVWVSGVEEDVLEALELRTVALVVGGLTRDSPWGGRVAFTRPYVSTLTIVAGPNEGLIEELSGLAVAVPRGSPAARRVEDADGVPVPAEEAGPEVTLSVREAHDLGPGEHVKMTLSADRHVVAVPPGENRWLIEVDRFFTGQTLRVRKALEAR